MLDRVVENGHGCCSFFFFAVRGYFSHCTERTRGGEEGRYSCAVFFFSIDHLLFFLLLRGGTAILVSGTLLLTSSPQRTSFFMRVWRRWFHGVCSMTLALLLILFCTLFASSSHSFFFLFDALSIAAALLDGLPICRCYGAGGNDTAASTHV